jgi:hypothetical protein
MFWCPVEYCKRKCEKAFYRSDKSTHHLSTFAYSEDDMSLCALPVCPIGPFTFDFDKVHARYHRRTSYPRALQTCVGNCANAVSRIANSGSQSTRCKSTLARILVKNALSRSLSCKERATMPSPTALFVRCVRTHFLIMKPLPSMWTLSRG